MIKVEHAQQREKCIHGSAYPVTHYRDHKVTILFSHVDRPKKYTYVLMYQTCPVIDLIMCIRQTPQYCKMFKTRLNPEKTLQHGFVVK